MAINPQKLLQAAMASGGSTGTPSDSMPVPGAASTAGGAATGPQGGMQDSLPQEFAGAQPTGIENSGVLNTSQLQNQLGVGQEAAQAGSGAAQAVQAMQNPNTPPSQKAMMQQQLQLAALRALVAGPTGAVGSPH